MPGERAGTDAQCWSMRAFSAIVPYCKHLSTTVAFLAAVSIATPCAATVYSRENKLRRRPSILVRKTGARRKSLVARQVGGDAARGERRGIIGGESGSPAHQGTQGERTCSGEERQKLERGHVSCPDPDVDDLPAGGSTRHRARGGGRSSRRVARFAADPNPRSRSWCR